jgi:hypothetical protein
MCAAVVEHVAVEEEVRAERRRILVTLLDDLDELTEHGVAALRAEIPAYHDAGGRFLADLRGQVRSHFRVKLAALLEDRMVTLEDIAFVRAAATPASRSRSTSTPSASASRPSGRRSSPAPGRRRWVMRRR